MRSGYVTISVPGGVKTYTSINPIGNCVVAMVEGYPSAGFETHMGCTFMEMEWTISMAHIVFSKMSRATLVAIGTA